MGSNSQVNTTELIIEHTIAGIQTTAWIILFILSFISVENLKLPNIPELILISISLSFVYPLGVVIDDIIDEFLKPIEKQIRKGIKGGHQSIRNLLIKVNDSDLTRHFDYIRRRIRIARTSGFNFTLLTLSFCLFLWKHNHQKYILITFFSGAIIVSICFTSWYLLTKSFYQKMAKRYAELGATVTNNG